MARPAHRSATLSAAALLLLAVTAAAQGDITFYAEFSPDGGTFTSPGYWTFSAYIEGEYQGYRDSLTYTTIQACGYSLDTSGGRSCYFFGTTDDVGYVSASLYVYGAGAIEFYAVDEDTGQNYYLDAVTLSAGASSTTSSPGGSTSAVPTATAIGPSGARRIDLVVNEVGRGFYLASGSAADPVIGADIGETIQIVVTNSDSAATHALCIDGVGCTTDLEYRDTGSLTFASSFEGSYAYYCRYHSEMASTISVASGDGVEAPVDSGMTDAIVGFLVIGGVIGGLGVLISRSKKKKRAAAGASGELASPAPPAAPPEPLDRAVERERAQERATLEREAQAQRDAERAATAAKAERVRSAERAEMQRQREAAQREAALAASRAAADALRSRAQVVAREDYSRLRQRADLESALARVENGDEAARRDAQRIVDAVDAGLKQRGDALREVQRANEKLDNLASRLANGELSGSSYEAASAQISRQRDQHEQKAAAIAAELFVDDFEKPI